MRYTIGNLKKLEDFFQDIGYVVRYEKGNFHSGYCIVENRNIAVINKFFDTESRINTLLEILTRVEVDTTQLSENAREFYEKIQKKSEVH